MSFANKSDWVGLAQEGLEIVANQDGASNQVLEVPGADGAFKFAEVFGSIKSPHCDYQITGEVSFTGDAALVLGKVYNDEAPFALKKISIHTGAGEKPTFGADAVQIEDEATQTKCTFTFSVPTIDPGQHALTFGALTYTESNTLVLNSSDFVADCEISPTTINGVPRASDAVKAYLEVSATFWSTSDTAAPAVTVATGWTQTADFACTGADGALFTWTATYRKYLAKDAE